MWEWHKRSLRVNTRLQRESAINQYNMYILQTCGVRLITTLVIYNMTSTQACAASIATAWAKAFGVYRAFRYAGVTGVGVIDKIKIGLSSS